MPSEFTSEYHVHIIVRQGEMRFSDGKQIFLYDLWTVYSAEMSQMETNDNAARISSVSFRWFRRIAASSAMWLIMPTCSASRQSISRR